MSDPDDTDNLDPEDLVADYEQEAPPIQRRKAYDPLPAVPLEQLLAFENEHPGDGLTPGKLAAIRATFGLHAVHYFMKLNRAIDTEEALKLDPVLVHRLRDQRTRRIADRANLRLTPRNTTSN